MTNAQYAHPLPVERLRPSLPSLRTELFPQYMSQHTCWRIYVVHPKLIKHDVSGNFRFTTPTQINVYMFCLFQVSCFHIAETWTCSSGHIWMEREYMIIFLSHYQPQTLTKAALRMGWSVTMSKSLLLVLMKIIFLNCIYFWNVPLEAFQQME